MDQQMGFIRANRVVRQKAPKAEDFLNVVAPRKHRVRPRLDRIVKAKRRTMVRGVRSEICRLSPVRVQNREDMRYAPGAVMAQLLKPANREQRRWR